jgi:WD40 repeat protein
LPGVYATCLAISPDGKLALVGNQGKREKTVLVLDLAKGEEVGALKGHEGPIFTCVYLPDGKRALTGSRDGTIRLWDVSAGKELLRFSDHTAAVSSVVVSADGKLALSASEDKTIRLWRLPE